MSQDDNNPLGKNVEYKSEYDPSLLFTIDRSIGRSKVSICRGSSLPFFGFDVWNCYEISWLNRFGKPQVAILRFYVACESPRIVESKSVKLYLNSFNNTKFSSESEVIQHIKRDLSEATVADVIVEMKFLSGFDNQHLMIPIAESIDDLDIAIEDYTLSPEYLKLEDITSKEKVRENLYSDLLRSNCLITNQPDWGSVEISYYGYKIDRESLLRYIVSFRNHNEFHEQCVERIFCDIMRKCAPVFLTVSAKYTRRGGIDINPIRSTDALMQDQISFVRLPRQ